VLAGIIGALRACTVAMISALSMPCRYEGNITEGLNVFRFSGRQTGGAIRLPHLNPQTQEFSLP
jgi:hypothetical protein